MQKDADSKGPSAEWVNARYELTDGARTIVLSDEILCPWNLMKGGRIMCKSSATEWTCLKIFPEIPESMKKVLNLAEDAELFFELPVSKVGKKLTIDPLVKMVHRLLGKETRKMIYLKNVVVSDFLPPKIRICVRGYV